MIRLFSFILTVTLFGCQALRTHSRLALTLSLAKELQAGRTSEGEILSRLGRPDRIIDMSETNWGGKGKIWAYFEDGVESSGRISFSFPADSDKIDSISFDVRARDPEHELSYALSSFPEAKFVKYLPKYWDNPHASPDEVFYEDAAKGLTIIYMQTPKYVSTISWEIPGRSTSSEQRPPPKPPYPYCIADACAKFP